ncbi:hypothetical protein AAFF_G00214340 [Aldrovandia affinis]|uniref:T-box domain-containing protein n=1 Tax=Aldrovandia affinis TaxID=143900 RepID=A0AAD7W5R0_9TELE|nr:hypothetical protein AAFF_G00214340 [Aldrovandia affinis]
MTSVESKAVVVHEEEEDEEEEERGEEEGGEAAGSVSPPATPLTTTPPTLFIVLKPGHSSQGEQDQGILVTDRECNLATASEPALAVEGLPSVAPEGPTAEGTPPAEDTPQDGLPGDSTSRGVTVSLLNNRMWNQFHGCGTEMILTKQGRRMFPYCSFSIAGLEPLRRYVLVMDIAPIDNNRWKWNGHEWEPGGSAEPHVLGRAFIHPGSPSTGQYWTRSPVSFYKLKLTNNTQDQEGYAVLHSMHRYLPRLHLVPAETAADAARLNGPDVMTFSFPQTEFLAVTAYQNMRITQLKIDYNPFAKGFREEGHSSRLARLTSDPAEPPLWPSSEVCGSNSSNDKLRHLQKTVRPLLEPSGDVDEESGEQELWQSADGGAEFHNNGVQSVLKTDGPMRGEKRPCPVACSDSVQESQLKVRRVHPERRASVHVEQEEEEEELDVDDVSQELQLESRPCVGGEGSQSCVMAARPSPDRPTALQGHAPMSLECEDRPCKAPAPNLNFQEKPGSTTKDKSRPVAPKPSPAIHTSLSPSHRLSPPSRKSLSPLFKQSTADTELSPVPKPLLADSDKAMGPHIQVKPGRRTSLEAAAPTHSPSGITRFTPTSSWKRKRKAIYSGRRRKCMKKSSLGAVKSAEGPVEAAMLPDLEDVEGLLFVSFVSKEALGVHLEDLPLRKKEPPSLQETTAPPEIKEVVESVEEKIARLQDLLRHDLQRLKHGQVVHTALQEAGLKLSSLDPPLAVDLLNLGVRLPLPPPVDDKGPAGLAPSPDGAPFVSRTGKTKDFTKIKGWREKFVASQAMSLKCADADAAVDTGPRNRSAFCSDVLDAYLEKEARLMGAPAARGSSPSSAPLILYRLPAKSSGYVRPLHSMLNKQALKPAPPGPKPPPAARSKPKAKPAPRPASAREPVLLLLTSHGAKPAAKTQPAAKTELASPAPPPPPGPGPTPVTGPAGSRTPAAQAGPLQGDAQAHGAGEAGGVGGQRPHPHHHQEGGASSAHTAHRTGTAQSVCTEDRLLETLILPGVLGQCLCANPAVSLCPQGNVKAKRWKSAHAKPLTCWVPPCGQEFCRLGCVCSSLAQGHRLTTHCRKPACMLGCSCLRHRVVLVKPPQTKPPGSDQGDLVARETVGEELPVKWQPHHPGNNIGSQEKEEEEEEEEKEEEEEEEEEKGKDVVRHFGPEGGVGGGDGGSSDQAVEQKGRGGGPRALYIPTLSSTLRHIPPPRPAKTYVPRPNPVVQDEDKDPVYRYFESLMTCARVREYMSKPPTERPVCSCRSVFCSGKEEDPYHNPVRLTPGEPASSETVTRARTAFTALRFTRYSRRGLSELRKVKAKCRRPPPWEESRRPVEIVSECDWEPERDRILAVLCQRMTESDLSQPFLVGPFLVQLVDPAFKEEGRSRPGPLRAVDRDAGAERLLDGWDGAMRGLPVSPCGSRVGLLTASKKQPGVPAKGLIKVNGKSYSQAKLHLGKMGALHPASRLAVYIAGRLQPTNRKRSATAELIVKSGKFDHSSNGSVAWPARSTGTVTFSIAAETTGIGTATTGVTAATASNGRPVLASTSILKPQELSPQPPGPAPADMPPASSLAPPCPRKGMALHLVPGAPRTPLVHHPKGQLVQLLSANSVRPTCSPGAVTRLPQPQDAACDSPSGLQTKPPSSPTALTQSPFCITPAGTKTSRPAPAAAKRVPSFLGHNGTYTFRIGPGGTERRGLAPTGFTLLNVPPGRSSRTGRREREPPGGAVSPTGP